jgi:hypothetical protein
MHSLEGMAQGYVPFGCLGRRTERGRRPLEWSGVDYDRDGDGLDAY